MSARAATLRAVATIWPYAGFEPLTGRIFIWEHIAKLHQSDAFAILLSGCFMSHLTGSPYT